MMDVQQSRLEQMIQIFSLLFSLACTNAVSCGQFDEAASVGGTRGDVNDGLPSAVTAAESDPEYQRFLRAFLRRPGPGIALERITAFHRDRGSLNQFCTQLQSRMDADPDVGQAALLGFLRQQRADPEGALQAFEVACRLQPESTSLRWMMGRSLIALKRADEAIEQLLPLVRRRLPLAELLAIGRDLNLAFRDADRRGELPQVWLEIEEASGNSLRVVEQTAWILRGEGFQRAAVERFLRIAAEVSDPEKAFKLRLQAAELLCELQEFSEARDGLLDQLESLRADSWQAEEVRRLTETCLAAISGDAGVLEWYKHLEAEWPDSLTITRRRIQLLRRARKDTEADAVLREAVKRLPAEVSLLRLQIEIFSSRRLFTDAALLYGELEQRGTLTDEDLLNWGGLQLQRSDISPTEAKQLATTIWNRPERPITERDTLISLADLQDRSGMPTEAEGTWQRLLNENPFDPFVLERLGSWWLRRGQNAKALEIWNRILDGDSDARDQSRRLAEILESYQFYPEAIAVRRGLCQGAAEITDLQSLISLLVAHTPGSEDNWSELESLLQRADQIAESDLQKEQQQEMWTRALQKCGRVSVYLNWLEQNAPNEGSETLALRAAHLYRVLGRTDRAIEWVERLAAGDRLSRRVAVLLSELYQQSGQLERAAEALGQMVRPGNGNSPQLLQMANLMLRLGRQAEARDLAVRAAAEAGENPNQIRDAVRMLQQAEGVAEAIELLEQLRVADRGLVTLSSDLSFLLVEAGRTEEAEQLIWKTLSRTARSEFPSELFELLIELQENKQDLAAVISRLESLVMQSREPAKLSRFLSRALIRSGDSQGGTRLLRILCAGPDCSVDDQLTLANVLREQGDFQEALQLAAEIKPGLLASSQRDQLQRLLLSFPEELSACGLLSGLTSAADEPERSWQILAALLEQGRWSDADLYCGTLPPRMQAAWRVRYLRGLCAVMSERSDAAVILQQIFLSTESASNEIGENQSAGVVGVSPRRLLPEDVAVWNADWRRVISEQRVMLASLGNGETVCRIPRTLTEALVLTQDLLRATGNSETLATATQIQRDANWVSRIVSGESVDLLQQLQQQSDTTEFSSRLVLTALLRNAVEEEQMLLAAALTDLVMQRLLEQLRRIRSTLSASEERFVLERLQKLTELPGCPLTPGDLVIEFGRSTGDADDLLARAIGCGIDDDSTVRFLADLRQQLVRPSNGTNWTSRQRDVVLECLLIVAEKLREDAPPVVRGEMIRLWFLNAGPSGGGSTAEAPLLQTGVAAVQPEETESTRAATGLNWADLGFLFSDADIRFFERVLAEEQSGTADAVSRLVLAAEDLSPAEMNGRQFAAFAVLRSALITRTQQFEDVERLVGLFGSRWSLRRIQLQLLNAEQQFEKAAQLADSMVVSGAGNQSERWLLSLETAFLAQNQQLAERSTRQLSGLQLNEEQKRRWARGMRLNQQLQPYQSFAARRPVDIGLTEIRLQLDELNLMINRRRADTAVRLSEQILARPMGSGAIRATTRRDQVELQLRQRARWVLKNVDELRTPEATDSN